ncbi:hypothetical protein ACHQM5_023703 [Ranunculus cassubicifolius]
MFITSLQTPSQIFSLIPNSPFSISPPSLSFPRTSIPILSASPNPSSYPTLQSSSQDQYDDDESIVGDCVVFEEGIFEDPYLEQNNFTFTPETKTKKSVGLMMREENLVPDEWLETQMEINITKKERRKIAQKIEYGCKIDRKNIRVPLLSSKEYLTYKEYKMSKLKPVVLDNPEFEKREKEELRIGLTSRVVPRNPRVAVYKGTLNDISEFFKSDEYVPGENAGKKALGRRKLLTKEEKVLLNKRIPNLENASSRKWLPLHTLAASGEFYLVDALLKHAVDINEVDQYGFTALHKAISCRKLAVTNYLLRESANPFIRDKEGATLMHYAVRSAAIPAIKILLLYNVDINLADDDGWTPLHLAVQTRRTDVVKLLLIKGADKTLRNQDGLTPLELCLYSGRAARTYEIIKLLKQLPKSRSPRVNSSAQ